MANGSTALTAGPLTRFLGIYSGRINAESDWHGLERQALSPSCLRRSELSLCRLTSAIPAFTTATTGYIDFLGISFIRSTAS